MLFHIALQRHFHRLALPLHLGRRQLLCLRHHLRQDRFLLRVQHQLRSLRLARLHRQAQRQNHRVPLLQCLLRFHLLLPYLLQVRRQRLSHHQQVCRLQALRQDQQALRLQDLRQAQFRLRRHFPLRRQQVLRFSLQFWISYESRIGIVNLKNYGLRL
jgi:hypothetical protein